MLKIILFWVLLPFVMAQALRLRRRAPRVTGAGGPLEGSVGQGAPKELIAIGDSIIAGVGAATMADALVGQTAHQLSRTLSVCIHWTACGSIGAGSGKILSKLVPGLPDVEADFMVLSAGVNDVTAIVGVRRWEKNLHAILAALRRHSPNAVVAVAGIPPLWGFPLLPQPLRTVFGIRGATFDASCRRVVAQHSNVVHVPLNFDPQPEKFSPDGFHPSETSYREFGRIVAKIIIDHIHAGGAQAAAAAADSTGRGA